MERTSLVPEDAASWGHLKISIISVWIFYPGQTQKWQVPDLHHFSVDFLSRSDPEVAGATVGFFWKKDSTVGVMSSSH